MANNITADLTQGRLWKQILVFSVPLMASNMLQVLFNMADIAVIGKFAGTLPLGSVGSTTILITLFTGFLIGMGGGVNALVARYFGAEDEKGLSETVHTSLILCLLLGLIITVIGLIFSPAILDMLNTKPELMDGAVLYLRIYILGAPALAIFNFGNAVFSAAGNTRKPLYYLLAAGIINIVLNLFFVIVVGMDVDGVALASIISQYISAVLILMALFKAKEMYALSVKRLRITKNKAVSVLAVGIPSGFQNAIFQIANLFIQTSVNSFSAVMVSGNSAAANLDPLIYENMAAFYTACSSFIGQNYGAGRKDRIIKSYRICLGFSFFTGLILGLAAFTAGPNLLSMFTDDPLVVEAGMKRLSIMGLCYGFSCMSDNALAASRGLGKCTVPTIILIMGSCVFRIIWVYTIFAHYHTIESLYLLYIFSWTITGVFEMIYFRVAYRQQTAIFKAAEAV